MLEFYNLHLLDLILKTNVLSKRIKPAQKTQGITNGTAGGMGQQQAAALCDISAQVQQYQQFLGEGQLLNFKFDWVLVFILHFVFFFTAASQPLPVFVDIDLQDRALPDGILLEHLKAFQSLYREHCEVGPSCVLLKIKVVKLYICA